MSLDGIRGGELVILDANILVYANQQKSGECMRLLGRCACGEVTGVVPVPMVAELMHALMMIEARENGWIDSRNPARALSGQPDPVRRLTNCEKQMRQLFGIGLRLEGVVPMDLIEALGIQRESGLLTNDALLISVARRLHADVIASADSAFQRVQEFRVHAPEDLGG